MIGTIVGVAVGSAVGAMARYAAELAHARLRARDPARIRRVELPWATLTVNVVASALLGAVAALAVDGRLDAVAAVILGAGLAGGLSTFSTFAVDVVQLVTHGRWRLAAGYVLASLVIGIGVAAVSYRWVLSARP